MNEDIIEIGSIHLNLHDVRKYWVDCESTDEIKKINYYQDNNYLGSVFSLLIAGVVCTYLARKKRQSATKKYLHIETNQNVAYCFPESEVNINDTLLKLKVRRS